MDLKKKWKKASFITLDRDLLKRVNFFISWVHSSSLNNFKMDWDKLSLLSFTENLEYLWLFGVGFMEKSLSVFEGQLFEKKVCQKQVFSACEKGAFFSVSVYFGNMPNFAGLWCPNHLTHRDSWGIIGKIISIVFIWYLVVLCVTASLVTIASWKSGLVLSSLKILISVLSNKAVLDLADKKVICLVAWSRVTQYCNSFEKNASLWPQLRGLAGRTTPWLQRRPQSARLTPSSAG